jgi:hypothetical protein
MTVDTEAIPVGGAVDPALPLDEGSTNLGVGAEVEKPDDHDRDPAAVAEANDAPTSYATGSHAATDSTAAVQDDFSDLSLEPTVTGASGFSTGLTVSASGAQPAIAHRLVRNREPPC